MDELRCLRRSTRPTRRQEGMALISGVVMIVVIAATTADFAYEAQVDYAAATNARDELRAHYLARSAMDLGHMLIRLQTDLIDPNRQLLGGMPFYLPDYASLLMSLFNAKETAEMFGSLLGVETGQVKGLGIEEGFFDLQIQRLDGRLNVNCAGGPNPGAAAVTRFATILYGMILPKRYDRLFETRDADGQYTSREQLVAAIVDWVDQDTMMFGGGGAEDYGYETGPDPYEIKDHYLDTVAELRLIRGVSDEFMDAFGRYLTVYGSCKVNVSLAGAPIIAAIIQQYARTPTDPALRPENLALLSRIVVEIRRMMGEFKDVNAFIKAVEDPTSQLGVAEGVDSQAREFAGLQEAGDGATLPPVMGVPLVHARVREAVVARGGKKIWQLYATSEVGRVKKSIRAVWDSGMVSQVRRRGSSRGAYVYWREE